MTMKDRFSFVGDVPTDKQTVYRIIQSNSPFN